MIAVVDDDRLVRNGISSLLRASGYSATTFDSAHAFTSRLHYSSFCLVIADFKMPGMNGIEFLEALRLRDDSVPFILITALPQADIIKAAEIAGAMACLRKPFDQSVLLALVIQAVGQAS